MSRPPKTLLFHTLAELAKLLALSASVLVLVIAMGAAIKPLSDGVLEAADAAIFISLALVPMLAYVLPFAAGFASTLVYHRLGTSNEALAQYAGGISHRNVLLPALVIGIGLMLGLGTLNEFIIPRFLREMRHMITIDFARLLSQEVSRGKALRLDDWLIFADRAERIAPSPGSGVREQVVFSHFAAIKIGANDIPEQEVAATSATMWLYPPGSFPGEAPGAADKDASVVVLEMQGVSASDATGVGGFRDSSTAVFSIPNVFRDNPKFLTYSELRDLRNNPDRMNSIDSRRRDLALSMQLEATRESVRDQIARGQLKLIDERGRAAVLYAVPKVWEASTGRLEVSPPEGKQQIELFHARDGDKGSVELHSIATSGEVRVALSQDLTHRHVTISIDLRNLRTREVQSQASFAGVPERSQLHAGPLRLVDQGIDSLAGLPSARLLDEANRNPVFRERALGLQSHIDELLKEALSKQHERWAMAVSCLVVTLTGAITALLLSQRMPLTTYLWTFVPGLVSWVTIAGGQQMTEQVGGRGLILMWSGVAALGVYAAAMYWKLAKH
ncbi:MAG: LptF/LptG family permease [Phycisphaerales bacterium]